MNIFQAQPQDVDKILPLYLGYRHFYQVEAQPAQALYERNAFVRDTDFFVYNKMLNK